MTKPRSARSASKTKPVITEAKLRKIIRDELARQHLVSEGIMDTLKSPFKKLGEKAKKYVAEKAEEILGKLKGALSSVKGVEEYRQFFSALETQQGGTSFDALVSSMPEYADLKEEAEEVKGIDLVAEMSGAKPTSETISYEQLKTSLILIEESYLQRQESFNKSLINESLVLTAAGAWWTAVKSVVGVCGLIGFAAESAVKICKYLGLSKVAGAFKKIHHFVEHVEELFLDKVAFPKPVQFAAYRAFWAVKGVATKAKGKEAPGQALDYKTFVSAEGKEEREATLKALHAAVIMVLVLQAVSHIIESVMEFFHAVSKSVGDTLHAAGHTGEKLTHAGVEASNLAKTARAAAVAGSEMAAAKSVRV